LEIKLSYHVTVTLLLAVVMATAREENDKFCITVGPVTRTVGILT